MSRPNIFRAGKICEQFRSLPLLNHSEPETLGGGGGSGVAKGGIIFFVGPYY
mgnify:CR=1 FL=1